MKWLVLAVVCLIGCVDTHPAVPTRNEMCVTAKKKLLLLQCADEGRLLGGDSRRGVPFETFCLDQLDQGIFSVDQVLCMTSITDCAQVDAVCSRR